LSPGGSSAAMPSRLDLEAINRIVPDGFPLDLLRRWHVLPLEVRDGTLVVGVSGPEGVGYAQALGSELDLPVEVELMPLSAIEEAINGLFEVRSSGVRPVEGELDFGEDISGVLREEVLTDQVDAPIIRLVNAILAEAVKERASDVHIEPQEGEVLVRYRIDGVLHPKLRLPKGYQAPLITRLKVMARMDLGERFVPQDGRIAISIGGKEIDVRVGLIPTQFGERLTLRLLDKERGLLSLEELGMEEEELSRFRRMIGRPWGMILFTGPTGSGKTTTLYAILRELAKPGVNVITIEDPIEYALPGVSQIQVNEKAGLTFASGLRSILRSDPDIVMVGEMRDGETARIGVQAALTGHLVLSTLHTNDSPSAVARLVDMGVEPFLLSSCLVGVVAQRLVRTVCPHCARPREADQLESSFGLKRVVEGVGCARCLGTGYLGRVGLYEQFLVDEEMADLIARDPSTSAIRALARRKGLKTLFEVGLLKVERGITTLAEVMRVAGG